MDRNGIIAATLALTCIVAVGTAATALDPTVATAPDEAIDLDYDRLPIEPEDAEQVVQQIDPNETEKPEDVEPERVEDVPEDITVPEDVEMNREADVDVVPPVPVGESGVGDAGGATDDTEDDENALLAVLGRPALVAAALGLLGIGLAVAGRHAWRARSGGGPSEAESDRPATADDPPAASSAANDVERAWLELLERVDVDWQAKTPREIAETAIDAGLDPDAVYALTAVFEEVQYGDDPPTDEQCRRARRAAEHLETPADDGETAVPAPGGEGRA